MPVRIVGPTPAQFIVIPAKLSMWLNDVDGDCVTAEEAFAKACDSPEIFITDDTVQAWATKNGVLDGAELTQVLDIMLNAGFPQDGNLYNGSVQHCRLDKHCGAAKCDCTGPGQDWRSC